jgi:hypothetical protein
MIHPLAFAHKIRLKFSSTFETLFLLTFPANREHLQKSMGQAERGETIKIEFPDDGDSLPQALRDAMKSSKG